MNNTLSLAELNRIAEEFGLEFHEPEKTVKLVASNKPLDKVQQALGDLLEERGSRWCEIVRQPLRGYFYELRYHPFTLVD